MTWQEFNHRNTLRLIHNTKPLLHRALQLCLLSFESDFCASLAHLCTLSFGLFKVQMDKSHTHNYTWTQTDRQISISPQMLSGLLQQSDWFAADWIWFWPVSGQADGNTCTSPGSSGPWCNPYTRWRCYQPCQSSGCHWGERSGNPSPPSHSFPAETPGTPLNSIYKEEINRDSTFYPELLLPSRGEFIPLVCPAAAAFERRKRRK